MTLSQYNPMTIETILRATAWVPPFPPAADRAAWEDVKARLGESRVEALLRAAESAAAEPIPALPASLWLECQRTGERGGYENPMSRRRDLLLDLALGECLERQGRFSDPLMDLAWAICEESSWVYPAHHTALADIERPYIDLGAVMTGFFLAEIDALVGAELPPEVGRRIRAEVDHRLFRPYLERHDFWWMHNTPDRQVNNWTAVCTAGVLAAAIYFEPDPARLADILARGMRSLDDYLTTFDADGGSTEGPGYWSYGFGYYTLIAQLVEHRTAGAMRLMDGSLIHKIGAFPLRTMLSQSTYVNFSDAPRRAVFIAPMLAYLARRLELPALLDLSAEQPPATRDDWLWFLRDIFWAPPVTAGALATAGATASGGAAVTPALRDWYPGMMWMIARLDPSDPNTLVLAAKGGHNDEMHNHNDVGSFIVHLNGESVVADIGCGRYTLQYFLDEERYNFLPASSVGHSVPLPNGTAQSPGRAFAARLLEYHAGDDEDRLRLDLKNAYPAAAGLSRLERSLALHRGPDGGWVELQDDFAFEQAPGAFETALTTFAEVVVGEGAVLLCGERGKLRVGFDPELCDARVDYFHDVEFSDGTFTVHRVAFSPRDPLREGTVRLEIVPVDDAPCEAG